MPPKPDRHRFQNEYDVKSSEKLGQVLWERGESSDEAGQTFFLWKNRAGHKRKNVIIAKGLSTNQPQNLAFQVSSHFLNFKKKSFCFAWMHVSIRHFHVCCHISCYDSYRWLWTTMWVLGTKSESFARAASVCNFWAISPVPFLRIFICNCVRMHAVLTEASRWQMLWRSYRKLWTALLWCWKLNSDIC